MSIFRRTENRDLGNWQTLQAFNVGGGTLMGQGEQAALTFVPLFAATSLISDSFCILPIHGYRDRAGVRRQLSPQPLLLTRPHPNPVFTRAEWLHQFCTSFLLRGNAFGYVTKVGPDGTPIQLGWMHPDHVRMDSTKSGQPVYLHNEKELDINRVVHIPWYPQPGSSLGLSPISQFRAQMETGTAATNYGKRWFQNGAQPSGHLKYGAGKLNPEQAAIVKTRFKASVAGNDIFVSGNDWEWKALSVAPEEAQFLQTIRAGANQIAAIYKVSPEDIGGEPATSLTYSTVEMNQLKFQIRALQPILTRFEMHMNRLLPANQYVKFNADALVRTDLLTRMQAHRIALETGMETQEEGRALEDRAPLTPEEFEAWKAYREAGAAPKSDAPSIEGGTR